MSSSVQTPALPPQLAAHVAREAIVSDLKAIIQGIPGVGEMKLAPEIVEHIFRCLVARCPHWSFEQIEAVLVRSLSEVWPLSDADRLVLMGQIASLVASGILKPQTTWRRVRQFFLGQCGAAAAAQSAPAPASGK